MTPGRKESCLAPSKRDSRKVVFGDAFQSDLATSPSLRSSPAKSLSHPIVDANMSSTPSGRRRSHSSRKSQSSTPASQAQATPKGSKANGSAAASSSPLFFQTSSPAKSTPQRPSQRSNDGLIPSSPRHASQRSRDGLLPSSPRQASSVADRDATPKASRQPLQGMTNLHLSDVELTPNRIVPGTIRRKLFPSAQLAAEP